MDNKNPNLAVVPIRAYLAAIEVAGDLEGKSTSKRRDHYVIVSVDGQEVAKSDKKPGQPAPRWEWPEDHEFLFHPSSVIKIAIYRESKTRITKYLIGQHTGKVIELLDNDATIDLKDKAGAGISSSAKIKINLSLVPEPEDTFKNFMKTMDDDVSRLQNALANASTPALDVLNGALQVTKNIMDIVADCRAKGLI
ncbi:hypothetical protein BJ912DRAFT_407270 [Pholiota molesta]|nr:hypothetical protein BJ912DRAFT_407270 [Pholiota molesta]